MCLSRRARPSAQVRLNGELMTERPVTAASLAIVGKVCLVTGVTSGLGRDIATSFAKNGAMVVGTGRRTAKGADLAAEIADPGHFTFHEGDVTDVARTDEIVAQTIDQHGRIDVLINNAGREGPIQSSETVSEDEWDEVLEVNLRGVFTCTRLVVPHMRAAGGGSIVNVSSTFAVEGVAYLAAYAASKAAVVQLSRSLAVEYLLDRIRVNSVLVGAVPSEASDRTRAGLARHVSHAAAGAAPGGPNEIRRILNQRGTDVANAVALLCADEARAITGSTIAMDRGMSAGLLTSTALARIAAGAWT
jgi:NAD(P)-dependent dehydrogenase (short-subunit alcohol dehydrogenase family)